MYVVTGNVIMIISWDFNPKMGDSGGSFSSIFET